MKINECLTAVRSLVLKGFFHAAIDLIYECESLIQDQNLCINGELYDELGKLKIWVADYHQAVDSFTKAISYAQTTDAFVKYNVHLGVAYRRLSEFDTCYRCFGNLQGSISEVSEETRLLFVSNFATINGVNGFYDRVIDMLQENLNSCAKFGNNRYDIAFYNNLGLAYLENKNFEQAERKLMKSAELSGFTYIETIVELGNLYMAQGNLAGSIQYAGKAMKMVFATNIRFEKDDVARLCNLLAKIAVQFGKKDLALRLYEKAQIFFGQLGIWRKWQDIDAEIEKLGISAAIISEAKTSTEIISDINKFLIYLEAVNAQELIDKRISKLLDMRVHYIKLFAHYLSLPVESSDELVLASRFADYGLTALESEVALNPLRSKEAFEQYKQHPALSVEMLKALNLPDSILDIIKNHHERDDGTGFPDEKKKIEINEFTRIFSIVDYYATGVSLEEKAHHQVMNEIKSQSGRAFTPRLVDAFGKMFHA